MNNGILIDSMAMNADFSSKVIKLNSMERVVFNSVITGAPDGLLQIQVSDDAVNRDTDVVNWIPYPDATQSVLGYSQVAFRIKDVSFKWMRLVYVYVGGSGTITTTFSHVGRF